MKSRPEFGFQGPLTKAEHYAIRSVERAVACTMPLIWEAESDDFTKHSAAEVMLSSVTHAVKSVEPHSRDRVLGVLPRPTLRDLGVSLKEARIDTERQPYPGRSTFGIRTEAASIIKFAEARGLLENS